jgi:hypothetical protein
LSIVTYEKDGAVGIVTLAKPPHNLIDNALLEGLLQWTMPLFTARSVRICHSPVATREYYDRALF